MSTGAQNKLKGKYDEVAGKMKQSAGEAVKDQSMANRGTAQQVKGNAEQAWGSVQQAASDANKSNQASAERKAHDTREKITSTAQNTKERVEDRAGQFRANHQTM
jgi:uncharacterized protein YjbJ (UPF0337 family)